jgi:hypothetical protein
LFPTLILDNSAISALYLNNFITSMSNRWVNVLPQGYAEL